MTSVVICTCNRASRLRKTLESIGKISMPPDSSWELLVVDNNSSDNTRQVVKEFAETARVRIRYLWEPRKGRSFALNSAIKEAKGEIIVFTDDDILVESEWLSNISKEFALDGELGVVGGRVELADPRDLPLTIVTYTTRKVIRSFIDAGGYMRGCCCAFRRSVLEEVGEFDTLLGVGSRFSSFEDLDYVYRVSQKGWKMLYAPSVLVFHNHGRRTPEAERALSRSYNIGRGAFYAKHLLSGDVCAAKLMYRDLSSRARLVFRRAPYFWSEILHSGQRDAAWACYQTVWLIGGFIGYTAYRVVRGVNRRFSLKASESESRIEEKTC